MDIVTLSKFIKMKKPYIPKYGYNSKYKMLVCLSLLQNFFGTHNMALGGFSLLHCPLGNHIWPLAFKPPRGTVTKVKVIMSWPKFILREKVNKICP